MNQCKNCYFYERIDDLKGRCHRYPPKMTETHQDGEVKNEGKFPVVDAHTWCGEWD